MDSILMVLLPEVDEVRNRDFMQRFVHETIDKFPHLWVFVSKFVH